jgi:hypothetical protein
MKILLEIIDKKPTKKKDSVLNSRTLEEMIQLFLNDTYQSDVRVKAIAKGKDEDSLVLVGKPYFKVTPNPYF